MKDASADFEVLSDEDQGYVIEFVKDLLVKRAPVEGTSALEKPVRALYSN